MTPDTCLTDYAIFLLAITLLFVVATIAGVISDIICSIRSIPEDTND